MADSAILVAHDGVGAALVRRHRHHMLIAGHDLDVDVRRLQREPVVVVQRGEVQTIGLSLLQLQDRPEVPQARNPSTSVRTVYWSTIACALTVNCSGVVL